jgi:hypothetical protein
MATIRQIETNRRNAPKPTGVMGMEAREFFREGTTAKDLIPVLEQLRQTRRRLERTYARAKRELERLQNARRHPNSSAPVAEGCDEALAEKSRTRNGGAQ